MRSTAVLNLVASAALVSGQSLTGTWPALDVVAPINTTWTQQVLALPGDPATVINACPGQNDWAITIDDGPSPSTPQVLDALAQNGIKATFFVVGSRIVENAAILKQAYDAGHQIALHSWSHADFATLTQDQIVADIMWDLKAIYAAIGVYPKYFRFPFGSYNAQATAVLGKMNLTGLQWSRDSEDWTGVDNPNFNWDWVPGNFSQWVSQPKQGTISLQHDLFPQTAAEFPKTLPIVKNSGYTLKTIAECLGDNSPYLTTNPILGGSGGPVPTTATNSTPLTSTPILSNSTPSTGSANSTKPIKNTGGAASHTVLSGLTLVSALFVLLL